MFFVVIVLADMVKLCELKKNELLNRFHCKIEFGLMRCSGLICSIISLPNMVFSAKRILCLRNLVPNHSRVCRVFLTNIYSQAKHNSLVMVCVHVYTSIY